MALDPTKLPEQAKKAKEGLDSTRQALDGMRGKMEFFSEIGGQLKELKENWKEMDGKEKLRKIGGLALVATLGWIFKKEDIEHFEKGHEDADEDEDLEETEGEEEYESEEEEARAKLERGEITQEEYDAEFGMEGDETLSVKQTLTNMYAIRYYKEDGSLHEKPNGLAKICIKEGAIPSKFILKRSKALFKNGVGSFAYFKKNVVDKLVHENVKDPAERLRQAAVILSCCAVGRFQIVPTYYFDKMGWPTRGETGLRAMYNFIRSTGRQISLFKKHLKTKWEEYGDVGLMAVSYYAGDKTAKAYQKNPTAEWATKEQFGGHGSIHGYAEKARKNFAKYKKELPGLRDIDYAAICIERNESGTGGVLYAKAQQGVGISQMKIRGEEYEAYPEDEKIRKRLVNKAKRYSDSNRFERDFKEKKELEGGNLGCAWVVSTILEEEGILDEQMYGTRVVEDELKARGWRESTVGEVRPGDIVFWAAVGKGVKMTDDGPKYSEGHRHIGIVVGENLAFSNSSKEKKPKIHAMKKKDRPIVVVLRPPSAADHQRDETLIAKRKKENKPTPKGAKPSRYEDLSPAVRAAAVQARRETEDKPIGTEVHKTIEGKTYVFQKQWHFNHPDTNPNGNYGIGTFEVA